MSGGADAPDTPATHASTEPDARTIVDARGAMCPMPIVKLQKAVKGVAIGSLIELIATDPGSDPDVKAGGRETGYEIVDAERPGRECYCVIRRGLVGNAG